MPLHHVQKSQIWCGRKDLYKFLCSNRQGYDEEGVLTNSNLLFPQSRKIDFISDSHFHIWPRTDVVFGLMICIEDHWDIPEFLKWCLKMEWKAIIAPEMYSQINRTTLMLNYCNDFWYSLKYSPCVPIYSTCTEPSTQVSQHKFECARI